MKKLVKFFMLFSLVLVLTNCSNDDDNKNNIVYFFNEPAVVESSGDKPVIHASQYRFIVPSVGKDSLKKGDLLWTSFMVDKNKGKAPADTLSYYEATDFRYVLVDSAKVIMPADTAEFNSYLADDYTAYIHEAVLYPDYLDKLLFFGFKRAKPSDDAFFDYELIWNPEKEKETNYPTLYIRSKKINIDQHYGHQETVFAFDMTEFINYYKKNISDKNPVYFNLKYKTGTDEDGNDIYRAFRSNPIMWQIQD